MREFFHGWRRKIGAMTLVMACVFMAGWLRAIVGGDEISFTAFHRTYSVGWEESEISWWSWCVPSPFASCPTWTSWKSSGQSKWSSRIRVFDTWKTHREIARYNEKTSLRNEQLAILNKQIASDNEKIAEFNKETTIFKEHNRQFYGIATFPMEKPIRFPRLPSAIDPESITKRKFSCWLPILPLTLLSAYLLLSKPRVAKPPDEAKVTHV